MKPKRYHLELIAFALIVAVAVLAVIILARGPSTVKPTVQTVAPQQAPQAKVIAKAVAPAATKAQDSLSCPPPAGEGVMGACAPKPVQVFGATAVVPAKVDPPASIPDVSSWQKIVNWASVKSWQLAHHFTPGGIFKMGEYVIDPYASRNNSQLLSLHMWRAGYWFLRKTGCISESRQIINEAHFLGLKIVFLDDEVPEARNMDGCITPVLKGAGLTVGEYASPGAYPGGSRSNNPAWIAAYGPLNPPLAPWGGRIVAFQCTDGVFGCVTSIPGVGKVDTSVDFGVTKLGVAVAPPKPRLICFGPKAKTNNPTCKSVRAKVNKWRGASAATHKALSGAQKSLSDYQKLTSALKQRAHWFDSKILTTTKQYS